MLPSKSPPFLIAACGNVMASDDAFGPLVAQRLREDALPHAEILDLGMKPAGLLTQLGDRAALIVVDAALPAPDFPVGTLLVIDFHSSRRPQLWHDAELSSHGLSIAHELEMARRLEMLPARVFLVAAAIESVAVGGSLSDAVRQLIEPAARRVRNLVEECLQTSQELNHA